MNFIIDRLKEPSTWSGIASIAVAFGLGFPPGTLEAITQIGVGIAGLAGIVMREKGKA